MDIVSKRRLAENEALFKQINEEVKEFVLVEASDTPFSARKLRFYCECSNIDCRERIEMTASEYQAAHSNRRRFTVRLGHNIPEVEATVGRTANYLIVEKSIAPRAPKDIDPKKML